VVPGPGRRRGAAAVDQGVQGGVQVEVRALDPVGEFFVGEAVAVARRDEEPLGEHGGGPPPDAAQPSRRRGSPREDGLEALPVQLPLPGPQAPPRGLVHLPGHPRGRPPHGAPAQPVRRREPDRDTQAHQVEVGGEDVVTVGRPGGGVTGRRLPRGPAWLVITVPWWSATNPRAARSPGQVADAHHGGVSRVPPFPAVVRCPTAPSRHARTSPPRLTSSTVGVR